VSFANEFFQQYHAHYSAQFSAGVAGPMIVHGPSSLPYDIDVGPVMLSDWYHIPYFALVSDVVGTNFSLVPPTSDTVLINGRGRFNCADASFDSANELLASGVEANLTWTCVDGAEYSAFRFQSGKTHRLRLMHHGANGVQKFSIDDHNLTVIAVDYVPVTPYTTDVVTLGVGQRTDVLVTAIDTPTASVWMRTSAPGGETCGGADYPDTMAAIYYESADTTVTPTSQSSVTDTSCLNDPLTITSPSYAITPSKNAWTQDISLTLEVNSTGHFEFRINEQAWHADYNNPLLEQAVSGNMTFEPQWNVYNFEQNTSIILNVTNNMPLQHPFHLHGHNFYVLSVDGPTNFAASAQNGPNGPIFSSGQAWNGTVVNPANPMRRDGVIIPPYGYAALQFELDNPGLWPFHCHVAWHLSGGQGMNVLYDVDSLPALPSGFTQDTCAAWDAYSATHLIDQIDAGA
jgi:FtsP/CotA-like multicopper oxidase with cupredoxin domain